MLSVDRLLSWANSLHVEFGNKLNETLVRSCAGLDSIELEQRRYCCLTTIPRLDTRQKKAGFSSRTTSEALYGIRLSARL